MSDYPMLISNKLHSFRNFMEQRYEKIICLMYRTILLISLTIKKLRQEPKPAGVSSLFYYYVS